MSFSLPETSDAQDGSKVPDQGTEHTLGTPATKPSEGGVKPVGAEKVPVIPVLRTAPQIGSEGQTEAVALADLLGEDSSRWHRATSFFRRSDTVGKRPANEVGKKSVLNPKITLDRLGELTVELGYHGDTVFRQPGALQDMARRFYLLPTAVADAIIGAGVQTTLQEEFNTCEVESESPPCESESPPCETRTSRSLSETPASAVSPSSGSSQPPAANESENEEDVELADRYHDDEARRRAEALVQTDEVIDADLLVRRAQSLVREKYTPDARKGRGASTPKRGGDTQRNGSESQRNESETQGRIAPGGDTATGGSWEAGDHEVQKEENEKEKENDDQEKKELDVDDQRHGSETLHRGPSDSDDDLDDLTIHSHTSSQEAKVMSTQRSREMQKEGMETAVESFASAASQPVEDGLRFARYFGTKVPFHLLTLWFLVFTLLLTGCWDASLEHIIRKYVHTALTCQHCMQKSTYRQHQHVYTNISTHLQHCEKIGHARSYV